MKNNSGFSLVELIVVIAIMAILAGVAVPTYSKYITKAKDASVTAQLDEVKTAAFAAAAEKNVSVTTITVTNPANATKTSIVVNSTDSGIDATKFLPDNYKIDFTDTSYASGATWYATASTGKVAGWNAN